jgi:hypothetical protein
VLLGRHDTRPGEGVAEIAWEMAKRSPAFREYFGVRLGSETTLSWRSRPRREVHAAVGRREQPRRLNVSLAAIVDELHAHQTAAVWNVLDTATGARLQPLLFAITTAGVDIGGDLPSEARVPREGARRRGVDESFFGINYTIDPGR